MSTKPSARFAALALLLAVAASPVGCAISDSAPAGRRRGRTAESIVADTRTEFERAIFYKPRSDPSAASAAPPPTLAPLIMEQVLSGADDTAVPSFPAVRPAPPVTTDPGRPTLYFSVSTVRIDGLLYDQVTYFWRYVSTDRARMSNTPQDLGLRITIGHDGFPIVWELPPTRNGPHVLFVSTSLESQAARRFSQPLPGRRWSIERSVAERPNVVVARIIEDGPIPMGPYVYVSAAPDRDVTTLLCRCSPSQVSEIVATYEYDIIPVETVVDVAGFKMPPVKLEYLLRWPTAPQR